jgi:CubicO group peptidase (beta-lactamase class C family)
MLDRDVDAWRQKAAMPDRDQHHRDGSADKPETHQPLDTPAVTRIPAGTPEEERSPDGNTRSATSNADDPKVVHLPLLQSRQLNAHVHAARRGQCSTCGGSQPDPDIPGSRTNDYDRLDRAVSDAAPHPYLPAMTKKLRTTALAVLTALGLPKVSADAQAWQQFATPEDAGVSSAALERARLVGDSLRSGGAFIVYRGRVLAAWGDVARRLPLHSVRKSLTSALVGIAVARGEVELSATLADLGIDDTTRLTAAEKRATVRDIIAARSGVYLPAAYAPENQDSTRPARGAHAPGTHWFYNNWDFNVAELIYQQRTGRSVYDTFDRLIATPLGMEDFRASDGFLVYEPSLSLHAAHIWRMSARDLARFGLLFLRGGTWNGRQVVPADWVRESTTPHSDLGNGRGYGYMWWTYDKGSYGDRYPVLNQYGSYAASGSGGQAIIVVPDADLVVVHRGDTDNNRFFPGSAVWGLVDRVLAARVGDPRPNPNLVPVVPVPYASQLPPLPEPTILPMDEREASGLLGEYDFGAPARIRVTLFKGRPFLFMPGRGDAELVKVGEDRYTVMVVPGVTMTVERDSSGRVTVIRGRIGNQRLTARRVS